MERNPARNPADQAVSHPYQPCSLKKFQPPSPLELPTEPIGPITMTSYMNLAPQNSAHAKEYGLNKPTPFNGNWTKVKAFLQECLWETLFHLAHNNLGNFGFDKSYEALRHSYFWPRMRKELETAYVPSCVECQRNKSATTKPPRSTTSVTSSWQPLWLSCYWLHWTITTRWRVWLYCNVYRPPQIWHSTGPLLYITYCWRTSTTLLHEMVLCQWFTSWYHFRPW